MMKGEQEVEVANLYAVDLLVDYNPKRLQLNTLRIARPCKVLLLSLSNIIVCTHSCRNLR
jgi:hypothetical protein